MSEKSLLQDFITETGEHLEETERNLLHLEQQPDDVDTLNTIFRSVHTIKGSSEYLGLEGIAELSHKLESLLEMLRRQELSVDGGMIDLMMGCNDRIGVLVSELDQHEEEKSSVDDLVARLKEASEQASGSGVDAADDVFGDDEVDEELFGIFTEQLKDGLSGLNRDAQKLIGGETDVAVFEQVADRLSTLRSSSNYMGYDSLKEHYEYWAQKVDDTIELLKDNQEIDFEKFIQETMYKNMAKVKEMFPKVSFDDVDESIQETAPIDEAPSESEIQEETPEADHGLLNDFITESGEHLEETERNLLHLEKQPDDDDALNKIFRSIHTIKGSSEYLGMEGIAELSHKLESLLDMLRRKERELDSSVIDLMMACSDRIGALISELGELKKEQSPIADLVSRLQEAMQQTGVSPESDEDGSLGEDEYDEELFGIFIEQLKEGLDGLSQDVEQLQGDVAAVTVLEQSADRLVTLRSSSNYMGYDSLTGTYENWARAVDNAVSLINKGEELDIEVFVRDTMLTNIEQVKSLFPKVSFDGKTADSELKEEQTDDQVDNAEDQAEQGADQGLLADFITETGEHLEETERNLLQLEQQPDDIESLHEIFRSVHTIKGSSEYLGMERIAELAHKLESLLDLMRRGERNVDSSVIDLLMGCNDRIGALVSELEADSDASLAVDDLLVKLESLLAVGSAHSEPKATAEKLIIEDDTGAVYVEEYDKELFAIFMEQFNAGLQTLNDEVEQLRNEDFVVDSLERCIERLTLLRSSANYMEYDELLALYDDWLRRLDETLTYIKDGNKADIGSFIDDVMTVNIEKAKNFFFSCKAVKEEEMQEPEEVVDVPPQVEEKKDAPTEVESTAFESLSLDKLEDSDKVVKLEPLPSSDEENSLLDKLADAFESRLGFSDIVVKQYFNENIENNLFSEDDPIPPTEGDSTPDSGDSPDSDLDVVDIKDVESLLFTGMGADSADKEVKLPKPLTPTRPERRERRATPERDGEISRSRHKIGRRQSDKFRDRMIKQSIRVDATKIDELMNQVGELVVSRSGFNQLFNEMRELQLMLKQSQKLDNREMQAIKAIANKINEATTSLGRVTSELQENVMKVRMLPIAQLFSRYPRVVHDLVRSTSKKVNLEIYGEETELDKKVIEQLTDPLIHIIRNAVDHGIEDTAERRQKGKNETGTIRMEAYPESNYVVIEISDDGKGIDTEKIKKRALEKELITSDEAEKLTEEQLLSFIMRPGFSTAEEVTHTSGRGVGMDVVKDNIEKINGTIDIISSIGTGARFQIKIPLTLAIIPALLVRVVNEIFTIPLSTVDETIRVHKDDISTIEGVEVYDLRGNAIPLIRLKDALNMAADEIEQNEQFVVIVNTGDKQVGFIVDELKARQEVVIKPLEDYLQEKSGFSGATILGDGAISLIIDVFEMVQISLDQKVTREKAVTL